MSKLNVVDINSPEFEQRVKDILSSIPSASQESFSAPRFLILLDGWIRDLNQGLDWGPSSDKSMNHGDAHKFCVSKGGRLPTRKELDNLLDLTKTSGACIDTNYFKDTKCEWYWTNTKVAWISSPAYYCVSFNSGRVGNSYEYGSNYVRPVRPSQC